MGMPLMLTPIHIAFLEMVIDPACSVVFEAEEEESDVMNRKPRDPKSPLLLKSRILWGIIQGTVAFVFLAIILITAKRLQMPENNVRALIFTSMVLMNITAQSLAFDFSQHRQCNTGCRHILATRTAAISFWSIARRRCRSVSNRELA
jgi:magnesium-transporting ATPase (P-type)